MDSRNVFRTTINTRYVRAHFLQDLREMANTTSNIDHRLPGHAESKRLEML